MARDIQYASRVDSPLFVKNPLQGVLQDLRQAATGTGEAALVLTADPLPGKDDGWDFRSRRLKPARSQTV